ncbi:MAG: NUDIX domain-containing protein [Chloroflexi bacterium]|nr:NUDIX domain-containing protein [Chloroflexota bacterium]
MLKELLLHSSHTVRTSAVIARDRKIVLVEFDDAGFVHFNLPGGGVQGGETIHDGLIREVREEIDCDVTVRELLFADEYQPTGRGPTEGGLPAIRLIFRCDLATGATPRMPARPDPMQTAVRWVSLDEMGHPTPLLPDIRDNLAAALHSPGTQRMFTFGP